MLDINYYYYFTALHLIIFFYLKYEQEYCTSSSAFELMKLAISSGMGAEGAGLSYKFM